jgi:hypothetical protein
VTARAGNTVGSYAVCLLLLPPATLGSRIGNAQGVEKAVPIDRQSALAHNQLGLRFAAEGKLELADREFKTALAIDPALRRLRTI